MKSLPLLALPLALPLVACTFGMGERAISGECPAGETCSDATPSGLYFRGATLLNEWFVDGPAPTAIGGTQAIGLEYDAGYGIVDLDQPYVADDDGGLGVQIDSVSGPTVTIRGVASRSNYLRITDATDGTLYDRKQLAAGAIAELGLVAGTLEIRDESISPIVFATGRQQLGVALRGDVQIGSEPQRVRLVDTSMQLAIAGGTQSGWDSIVLANATAGTHAIAVTAGDRPTANLEITIVDHADTITVNTHDEVELDRSTMICFSAHNAGRYIAGLTWSFETNNGEVTGSQTLFQNCAFLTADRLGPATLVATAAGQQVTVNLTVQPATNEKRTPKLPPARRGTSAGDRAAM